MQKVATFFRSSVGQKVLMAATGVVLYGFVIGHMVGNLQVYLGPRAMNDYAVFLRAFLHGSGLWIARSALLLAVGLHIWAATVLTLRSWAARPVGYREKQSLESTYASRTMVWSGPILFLFVTYHLLHLTFGTVHPSFREGDVYHNFIVGFRSGPVAAAYIVAMVALGLHMYHGFWSMLHTLGLSHARWNHLRHAASTLLAVVVVAGNVSFPVAVRSGFIHE